MIKQLLLIFESYTLYMPFIIGGYITFSLMKIPYFSIETSFVTGAIIASKILFMTQNVSPFVSLITTCCASVVGGCAIGLIAASLTSFGRMPHLLANIITIGIGYGINLFLLQSSYQSLTNLKNPLTCIFYAENPELIVLTIMNLGVGCIIYSFLKTQLGVCIKIYGNNPLFFKYYDISTSYILSSGEILASGLAGLSGYFVAQSSGFVDVNAGNGLTLFCLTTLILGKTFLPSRASSSFMVPITGLLFYTMLQQCIISSGVDLKYFTLIQSLIITAILIKKYRHTEQRTSSDTLGV